MDDKTKARYEAKAKEIDEACTTGKKDISDAALKGLEYIEGFIEDAHEPEYRLLALEQAGRYIGVANALVTVVQTRNDLVQALARKRVFKKGLSRESAEVTADIYLAKILKLWVEKDKAHDTE